MKLKHGRRSIRLKGYDYSQAGAYFVTVCVQGRRCLLGNVDDNGVIFNWRICLSMFGPNTGSF
ncbi:MAG: hypothetical protein K8F52_08970 [Candidatus Scalindua rubra]|nr:hypothetical protein [Candidatus Scalindua rubra]